MAALFLALLLFGLVLDADAEVVRLGEQRLPAICLSRVAFDLECPGCGLMRGVVLTLDGELSQGFALHEASPFVVALALALLARALFQAYKRLTHKKEIRDEMPVLSA